MHSKDKNALPIPILLLAICSSSMPFLVIYSSGKPPQLIYIPPSSEPPSTSGYGLAVKALPS